MFDHFHHHSTHVSETRTIHEHRAPTDASIKLAEEMEQKVLAKILGSVRLDGCEFDCVVHYMKDNLNLRHNFVIDYKLGSTSRRVNYQCDGVNEKADDIAPGMIKALSEDVACAILAKALPRGLTGLMR